MSGKTLIGEPPTCTQLSVLQFAFDFYKANDQLPPLHSISFHFGWKSATEAATHVYKLMAKGYLDVNVLGKYKFTEAGRALLAREAAAHA